MNTYAIDPLVWSLLLVIGLWRLLATPATPKVSGDHDPDVDKVRAILANAEVAPPESPQPAQSRPPCSRPRRLRTRRRLRPGTARS